MSSKFINIKFPFFYPDDNSNSGVPQGSDTQDIINFLAEDDDEKGEVIPLEEDKKKSKEKDQDDDSDSDDSNDDDSDDNSNDKDELSSLEDDLKEPTEEDLELVTPVRRSEILAKYPKLFKEFPYLDKAYYREQQFTEVFSTPADAKEAQEQVEILNKFEADLTSGNSEMMLTGLKTTNIKGFNKLIDNFLPTLAKVDEAAYHNIVGNIIKHTIFNMVTTGREEKNEALEIAAQLVNKFVFNKTTYEAPRKLAGDDTPEEKASQEDNSKANQLIKQQFDNAREDLNVKVNNSLKSTIMENIDPKGSMTEYVKKQAVREAFEEVVEQVNRDPRLKVILDRLWKKAQDNNFSRSDLNDIKSAYFSRAKGLLPTVIKKARIEALKGMGKKVSEDKGNNKDKNTNNDREERSTNERSAAPQTHRRQASAGKITRAADIPKGMSTLDFLNDGD